MTVIARRIRQLKSERRDGGDTLPSAADPFDLHVARRLARQRVSEALQKGVAVAYCMRAADGESMLVREYPDGRIEKLTGGSGC